MDSATSKQAKAQIAQRLRKNISSYLGETIDIDAVLSDCLAAAKTHRWAIEEIQVPSKPS
jgi:hypothetical protein